MLPEDTAAPIAPVPPATAEAPGAASPQMQTLGWGLFWRLVTANAGVLFFVSGVICFFAYNWAAMPPFAKFGLIAGVMAACGGFALLRGFASMAGGLALLACGLLAGPLLAVYGQIYQTGADAWELFRGWALFLAPLACLGLRTGLWFALWLTATLWAGLYLLQGLEFYGDRRAGYLALLYMAAGQSLFFIVWEIAARALPGPAFAFLRSRWLPRCVGGLLILGLACILSVHIVDRHAVFTTAFALLYSLLMVGGAYWYTRISHDLFLPAAGMLSLLVILITAVIDTSSFPDTASVFLCVILIIAHAAAAGKLLLALHAGRRPAAAPGDAVPRPGAAGGSTLGAQGLRHAQHLMRLAMQGKAGDEPFPEHSERADAVKAPWAVRLLMGVCAWIAVPFIIGLMVILFGDLFSKTGFIVISLFLLGLGMALSTMPGIFTSQAGLCLSLAGALAASVLIPLQLDIRILLLLPAVFICGLSGFFSHSSTYRYLGLTAALTLTFLQMDLYARRMFFEYGYFNTPVEDAAGMSYVTATWIFAAIFAAFSGVTAFFSARGVPGEKARTVLLAAVSTVLIAGLLPVLLRTLQFSRLFSLVGIFLATAGVGAAAGLFLFALVTAKQLALSPGTRAATFLLCLAALAVSYRFPWFGAGLFALVLARRSGSLPMLGAAVLYLAACTVFEYYNLATTLLSKSQTLCAIGAVLCLTAAVLHHCLTKAAREERLPAPDGLFAPEPQASGGESRPGFFRPARPLFVCCLIVFLLVFSWQVKAREDQLAAGTRVVLALRPVDPRSLMQGDYMVLSLDIEDDIDSALPADGDEPFPLQGIALIREDEEGVCRFVKLEPDAAYAHEAGEIRVRYRGGKRRVRVGPGSFFFQEGYGQAYAQARFAELRVDVKGNVLITYLLDKDKNRISPEL